MEAEHVDSNPAKDVPFIKTSSQGFHSWTIEEVRQYEVRHPIGTRARLAELGATDREIMAITGHQTAKEVDRYTKGTRQKKLAASAMKKWEQGRNE